MRLQAVLFIVGIGMSARAAFAQPQEPMAPPADGAMAQPVEQQPVQQPPVVTPAVMPPAIYMEAPEPAPAENSIYIEGLGAGLFYSLNYERLVVEQLAVRIGFSYTSWGASATAGSSSSSASSTYLTFPITASYIGVRGGKHSLELGGGMTLVYASGSASAGGVSATGSGAAPLGILMVGYRLHPIGRAGFQFRVGAMALIGQGLSLSDPDPDALGMLPWAYMSLGASF